jgi:hypothetical protein
MVFEIIIFYRYFLTFLFLFSFLEDNHLDINGNVKYGAFHPLNPNRLITNMKELRDGVPMRRGPLQEDDFRYPYFPTEGDID